MTPAELEIHQRNTLAFIQADPVTLTLSRREKVPTDAGGYVWQDDVPVGAQTFRMIPASDSAPEVKTSSGRLTLPSFVLMGVHDANMQRWDKFTINGETYELASDIRPLHSVESVYERKADAAKIS